MNIEYPQISIEKHNEKYAKGAEVLMDGADGIMENFRRVAVALASKEKDKTYWEKRFLWAFEQGFVGGGRIMSAAGTNILATLINCFVQPIADSIDDWVDGYPPIFQAQDQSAKTMKRGGGVGYAFDVIRPANARVHSVQSISSGPISFIHTFNAMCKTVSSAGNRRGAQMAVMKISHPDIIEFINVKKNDNTFSQFNMSVGVTDEFMEALIQGKETFELYHREEPSDDLISKGAFKREDGNWVYATINPKELWDLIMANTYENGEPGVLYLGTINRENNLYWLEVIRATNPCAEQPLPPWGCCCLGAIILTQFVRNPFTQEAYFDTDLFVEVISVAHRALDNVLDITLWPLEEQRKEAMSKRRIGLGATGLGNVLTMLGKRYDSDEGRRFAEGIFKILRDESYRSSIDLAKEKGSFPLYDERYLDAPFIKRLPKDIRGGIKKYGTRNSHSITLAPAGTISLSFGKNCSNGVEPAFSWSYKRKFRMPDGSDETQQVEDYSYAVYKKVTGISDIKQLPDYFVSAMDISAEDHMLMLKVLQPYIDSSISKTVNIPEDYPYEDFKNLYLNAWQSGLKGLATFRPNPITGSVLMTNEASDQDLDNTDPDRKISFPDMPQPALNSLDMPRRPVFANGNPSKTYLVNHPESPFSVVIGESDDESVRSPFEVWVNGYEAPTGLSALAKILSTDMRSVDRAFLKMKLDSIAKTAGTEFDFPFPPDGDVKRVPSTVAALARIVTHRCEELSDFESDETPLLDALLSRKEPRSGTDGTLSWTVDIKNPATGDDFCLFIKEARLEDGTSYPYSVWMSGDFPEAFAGICICLSIDMRIVDPAWVAKKLRGLIEVTEPQGDFMAFIPGEEKQMNYPSTIAYVAELILHRYKMLGILNSENQPLAQGLFRDAIQDEVALEKNVVSGKKCDKCGVHAVIKAGGCDFCTSCGETGSCG